MLVEFDLKKTIDENASFYFEKYKKMKQKLEGAKFAYQKKLSEFKKASNEDIARKEKEEKRAKDKTKKEWHEKFRWFFTSTKKLVILGRDATTNEIAVKKHVLPSELIFHTEMPKSPFAVIKADSKDITKEDIEETADAVATFSQAWQNNIANLDVFYVKPDQVTKESRAGEFVAKGAFMIYGKKNILPGKLNLSIGIMEGKPMAGPENAIKANCKEYISLVPGKKKSSEIAKLIQKKLGGEIDDIIRILPSGSFDLKR